MQAPIREWQVSKYRWLVLCVFLVTSIGCYKYVPVDMDAVATGDHVRALLSTEAQQDVQARMGKHYTILDGKLLDQNDQQLLLSVPTVKVESQYGSESLHQRIDLMRQGIVRLDIRQVDQFKTYGLIGVAAGAAALITAEVFKGGEPGSPSGGGSVPNEHILIGLLHLTLFRW